MKPLRRSRTFWVGLGGLSMIAGLWISSAFWFWSVSAGGHGFSLEVGSGAHRITLLWSKDDGTGRWLLVDGGSCEGEDPVFAPLESEFFHIDLMGGDFYSGGTQVIPYWLVAAAGTGSWLALLTWRGRRYRKLAAARAIPKAVPE